MICSSPLSVKDPAYSDGKHYMQVPCGKCPACLKKARDAWITRLTPELKHSSVVYFVTLTYDNMYLPLIHPNMFAKTLGFIDFSIFRSTNNKDGVEMMRFAEIDIDELSNYYPSLYPYDVQHFITLCNNYSKRKLNIKSPRFFACGEYGGKFGRPHYHLLMFFPDFISRLNFSNLIKASWKYGNVDFSVVDKYSDAVSRYCTKYIMKNSDSWHHNLMCKPPFRLMSKGIGKAYVDEYQNYHVTYDIHYITDNQAHKYALPRYLSDKIFGKQVFTIFKSEQLKDNQIYSYETAIKKSFNSYQAHYPSTSFEEFRLAVLQGKISI